MKINQLLYIDTAITHLYVAVDFTKLSEGEASFLKQHFYRSARYLGKSINKKQAVKNAKTKLKNETTF